MSQQPHMPDIRNLIIAVVLSTAVLLGWQILVEEPKRQAALEQAQLQQDKVQSDTILPNVVRPETVEVAKEISREDELAESKRVTIDTGSVKGSINLQGLRIDDIILSDYNETIEKDSKKVVLLSPSADKKAYFAEFGWLSSDKSQPAPNNQTQWNAAQNKISSGDVLNASWDNGRGLHFQQNIEAKDAYLFAVSQSVTNHSSAPVTLYPYGLINRRFTDNAKHFYILHEGPLGVFNDALTEVSYKKLRDDPKQSYENSKGWLGITDKYWLTALIPDQTETFNANMIYQEQGDKYQVDYLGEALTIAPGETVSITNHFFAGAKKVDILEKYKKEFNIPLFDRAVDFGMLYFLTKPIFHALQVFYAALGNFGLAIMALTVCIKLLLFPLANKSYKSMSAMKVLMPKITEIRERYADDKMKMNQEIMEFYKKEKVNPASGCMPMLLQIPIFFSLYKVLFVTIEMRHAPFYGWIHDLSAKDPTSIANLFGLIPWDPPQMLMIGAWPIIMAATMVIQQKLNPKPTDPTQAMVMAWLPFIFLFLFASFPAGLVIYWAWNNSLSIIQQWVIARKYRDTHPVKA